MIKLPGRLRNEEYNRMRSEHYKKMKEEDPEGVAKFERAAARARRAYKRHH